MAGEKRTIADPLNPKVGQLMVMAVAPSGEMVEGAEVEVDGQVVGTTPFSGNVIEGKHYVVVQTEAGGFSDEDSRSVVERLEKLLGEGSRVGVELVDDIPREPSGKYRWIVSKVNPIDFEPNAPGRGTEADDDAGAEGGPDG